MIMRDLNIMETFKQSVKIKNIEFLRFIFAVFIVYFHLFSGSSYFFKYLSPYIDLYKKIYDNCCGYLCVEYFFIIAGFFLIIKTNFNNNIIDFAKKKIMRLWPALAAVTGLYYVISLCTPITFYKYTNIMTLLMVNHIGLNIGISNNVPLWFIIVLFWCSILYFYIIKNFSEKHANFIIAIISILAFSARIHTLGVSTKNVFILNDVDVLRGLYCLGIGYFVGKMWSMFRGGGASQLN